MAIIPVKKVYSIVLKRDVRTMLRALQKEGLIEISQADSGDGLLPFASDGTHTAELENQLADIRQAIGVIKRYDKTKKGFLAAKPPISAETLREGKIDAGNLQEAIAVAKEIEETMSELRQRQSRVLGMISSLEPFATLGIPMKHITATAHTQSFCGFLKTDLVETVCAGFEELDGLASIENLGVNGEYTALLIVLHESIAEAARAILKDNGFSETRFEALDETPDERIAALKAELEAILVQKTEQEAAAAAAAEYLNLLMAKEDFLTNELERERAMEKMASVGSVAVLTGFISANDQERLTNAFSKVSDEYYVEFSDPDGEEPIPTIVRNTKLLTPFETVTDMYDIPNARGIDPTPFMSFFFFVFFGMIMADVGYGILLSVGALALLKIKKPTGMFKKVTQVIGICGISTVAWGILFGGYFAIEGAPAPVLFSPLGDPMSMLILSIAIGYVHIMFSMGVGLYMAIKRGDILDGICDIGLWMVVLLGIPVMLLAGMNAGLYVMAAGAFGILVTAGRKKKNIFMKVGKGLSALYGSTSYLSDLLSYSRLFGMALSGSVIGMVFNTIGGMMMGGFIGYIFGIVIIIAGHLFNLALSSLGAYVHSCRLQYIESYGKFFMGNGSLFKPLSLKTKNFRIEG